MDRCYEILIVALVCCNLLTVAHCAGTHAAAEEVQFDALPLVECRDVTSGEFAAVNPHERLFEARFRISSLMPRGDDEKLVRYLYHIESPHQGLVVVDYLPQTTLATDVVEHFNIERQREDNRSLGITVTGRYDQWAQGSASAGSGKIVKSSVRYELLPPLELLASSGTVSRGSGVYFKLRPSRRSSLEGAKEFVLVFRVPRGWRGDYMQVRCEAVGRKEHMLPTFESEAVWGDAVFLVALYAEGDAAARETAAALLSAGQELRDTAIRARREIRRLAYPNMSLQLGRLPKLSEPSLSAVTVDRFLANPEQVDLRHVAPRLPADVRVALASYATAKRALADLNGQDEALARTMEQPGTGPVHE